MLKETDRSPITLVCKTNQLGVKTFQARNEVGKVVQFSLFGFEHLLSLLLENNVCLDRISNPEELTQD